MLLFLQNKNVNATKLKENAWASCSDAVLFGLFERLSWDLYPKQKLFLLLFCLSFSSCVLFFLWSCFILPRAPCVPGLPLVPHQKNKKQVHVFKHKHSVFCFLGDCFSTPCFSHCFIDRQRNCVCYGLGNRIFCSLLGQWRCLSQIQQPSR